MVQEKINYKAQDKAQKSNKKSKKDLAKKILLAVLEHHVDFAMGIVESFRYPHATRDTYQGSDSKHEIKREINRLKQNKYIEERKRGNRLELYLTEKGKKAALRYNILNCNNQLKDKYCIVVFDIPETERNTRNFFRRFLKEAGFLYLQQSVWVTQKNIEKNLIELIRTAGAEKWIHVITATKISNFSFKQKKIDKRYIKSDK